ncbi:hypothetical protein N7449_002581 [Penicillium cf. viridicatum]|uniref:Uncharacterized protein n=1 Tax=Penicillium cf. viridicatum TaxID=2972119 RepID=A0A9W9T3J5_9EURO|nr:hypothetical protein N7449_002581 [Penicillium cf. viridicatum]
MVQAVSTTGTQRSKPWEYGSASLNFSTNGCLDRLEQFYHFSHFSPILSITFIFIYSLIYQRAKVENLYDPGSPCSSSPPQFPRFPDYYSLSHHTATSFPAQRPLGNDLKALSLFILWSPLTSNAELQPSPIYQPPRPPAALTL